MKIKNVCFGTVMILGGGLFILSIVPQPGHNVSNTTFSYAEIVNNWVGFKNAANKCWVEENRWIINCTEAIKLIPKSDSAKENYFMTIDGNIIGVNYHSKVVVLQTPIIKDKQLVWHCATNVSDKSAKACNGKLTDYIISNNLEK